MMNDYMWFYYFIRFLEHLVIFIDRLKKIRQIFALIWTITGDRPKWAKIKSFVIISYFLLKNKNKDTHKKTNILYK